MSIVKVSPNGKCATVPKLPSNGYFLADTFPLLSPDGAALQLWLSCATTDQLHKTAYPDPLGNGLIWGEAYFQLMQGGSPAPLTKTAFLTALGALRPSVACDIEFSTATPSSAESPTAEEAPEERLTVKKIINHVDMSVDSDGDDADDDGADEDLLDEDEEGDEDGDEEVDDPDDGADDAADDDGTETDMSEME